MQIKIGDQSVDLKIPSYGPKLAMGLVFIFLIAACLLDCFYTVSEQESAVITRFGKHIDTVGEPGLKMKIPYVDRCHRIKVGQQKKMEFGFGTRGATNVYQYSNDQDREKSMVTGDLNAALVEWVVQYKISEPADFLFKVEDPELTLRDATESIMREVIGDRTVDEVITIGRQEIEANCREKLAELVKLYELGISIDQVQLINVDPPVEVQASFNEVNKAEQEKERAINQANGEYNRVIPRARGEAEQKISAAQGYAAKRINEAEGDVARFSELYTEYKKAPAIMKRRIYLETMQDVVPKLNKKIILDSEANQILPLLQLNQGQPIRK